MARMKWPFLGALWGIAAVLGFVGLRGHFLSLGLEKSPFDLAYLTLQLFTLESGAVPGVLNWSLQLARFLAPAVTLSTAAFALAALFQERWREHRVRMFKDHVVICGLGRKGFLLAKQFREQGHRVVILEKDPHGDFVKPCRSAGGTVLVGNAALPASLARARVQTARCVISVCGEDGVNAEVAVHARELARSQPGRVLQCVVHIVDPQLCQLLRERELELAEADSFRLEFFNVYETGARALLAEHPPFCGADDGCGGTDHLIVVGVGHMGETVVANVARMWHAGEASRRGPNLRITLVDRAAKRRRESLLVRYPQIAEVCDLTAWEGEVQGPAFERGDFLGDGEGAGHVRAAYVCLDDDSRAMAAGLALRRRFRADGFPVVVRMATENGLAVLLAGEAGGFRDLHGFSFLERTCNPELLVKGTYEVLARAMHGEYVANEVRKGLRPEENPSMCPWEELPEDMRESNRSQAEHIRVKLEAIGCELGPVAGWEPEPFEFRDEELERLARMEHERFVAERIRQGWRRGEVKDLAAKTNPTLVPWEELSEEEKEKDRLFVREMPAFLARVGFQVLCGNRNRQQPPGEASPS